MCTCEKLPVGEETYLEGLFDGLVKTISSISKWKLELEGESTRLFVWLLYSVF
jgi:hypothetical protein